MGMERSKPPGKADKVRDDRAYEGYQFRIYMSVLKIPLTRGKRDRNQVVSSNKHLRKNEEPPHSSAAATPSRKSTYP